MTSTYQLGRMLVLGAVFDDAATPPYSRRRWPTVFDHLAQILGTKSRPSVRARRVDSNYKTVKTGRPTWTGDDSQAWLGTEAENPAGYFFDMDVAFPTWATCASQRTSPTAYFAMRRSFADGKVASTCLVALELDRMRATLPVAYRLVHALQPSNAAECSRSWGDPTPGGDGFSNAITDGISFREIIHRDGDWKALTSGGSPAAADP